MTVFTNCYSYNPPEYAIYNMAQTLEQAILKKLESLPTPVSLFFRIYSKFGTIVTSITRPLMMLHIGARTLRMLFVRSSLGFPIRCCF